MNNYLLPLETKLKSLLPVNIYFTLEDGDQSFVVYPTNYITLTNDFISIQVGHIIYGNITEYKPILDNISELYSLLTDYADTIGDHCSISFINDDNSYRLIWGGCCIDEQDDQDFLSLNGLIDFLKTNK
tara:strand:- start:729 stop:1115 length:387 start_codon:yes stop_codon:yes gene_type:complete